MLGSHAHSVSVLWRKQQHSQCGLQMNPSGLQIFSPYHNTNNTRQSNTAAHRPPPPASLQLLQRHRRNVSALCFHGSRANSTERLAERERDPNAAVHDAHPSASSHPSSTPHTDAAYHNNQHSSRAWGAPQNDRQHSSGVTSSGGADPSRSIESSSQPSTNSHHQTQADRRDSNAGTSSSSRSTSSSWSRVEHQQQQIRARQTAAQAERQQQGESGGVSTDSTSEDPPRPMSPLSRVYHHQHASHDDHDRGDASESSSSNASPSNTHADLRPPPSTDQLHTPTPEQGTPLGLEYSTPTGPISSNQLTPAVAGPSASGESGLPVASDAQEPNRPTADFLKLWALLVLSATYVHQASTGYSIPIMLPMISTSLSLSDFQGALLTSGYSYLYALALIPAGILADKQNRPRLLGFSALAWSGFCAMSSQATSFGDLMISRIGLATAQSSQNVICFSMIPDLFPKNKAFALATYNSAIYLGRGLMYVLLTGARSIMFPTLDAGVDGAQIMSTAATHTLKDASGNLLVPLEKLDLRLVQIMYTTGDMAAIRAISPFDITDAANVVDVPWINEQMWRTVLKWLAIPGFLLAGAMLLTVPETRKPPPLPPASSPGSTSSMDASVSSLDGGSKSSLDVNDRNNSRGSSSSSSLDLRRLSGRGVSSSNSNNGSNGSSVSVNSSSRNGGVASMSSWDGGELALGGSGSSAQSISGASMSGRSATEATTDAGPAGWAGVTLLVQNSAFMSITIAAALNDVASYALVAWQSTFYERVYDLSSDQYAPILATVLPVAGILGGVGGGALADKLALQGRRGFVTVGASLLAAPFIWASIMADNPTGSYVALGVGFALSESWRAPAAVMARSVAPPSMSSTASAIYLSVRNIIGGLGPLAVAQLATTKDLRSALELLPLMYLFSGVMFGVAEFELGKWKAQQQQLQDQEQEQQQQQQQQQQQSGGSA